eukprot:3899148-Rhodomonas_salina.1
MPRRRAADKEERWTLVHKNKMIESTKWVPPQHDRWCSCNIDVNGVACAVGCELKQQRRKCKGCLNGSACVNNVIQLGQASFQLCETIDCGERGKGLAFLCNVESNTLALEYTGELISEATARRRLELNVGRPTYSCQIVKGWVIDGRRMGSMARWINSSHDPNCVLETWWVGNTPHVMVRTLRRIGAGEEITVEYAFDFDDREACLCWSARCSGWIGGRRKQDRAPFNPSTLEEPTPRLLPSFSRSILTVLSKYELFGDKVPGDGNCLYHSAAILFPSRSHREWREAIADDMETVTGEDERKQYLDRANNDVREGLAPYETFDQMIRGVRNSAWGNGDCIRHLSLIVNRGIIVFTQASNVVYYEWNTRQEVNCHVFLFNSRCPTTGKLVHFDPCRSRGELSQAALNLMADLKDKHTQARMGGEVLISSDSEEEVQRVDTPSIGARDSHPGILRSAIQHEQLTTYLHSQGMAASRVAGDNHCFYSSASNTPAHDYSGLSVQEIRL